MIKRTDIQVLSLPSDVRSGCIRSRKMLCKKYNSKRTLTSCAGHGFITFEQLTQGRRGCAVVADWQSGEKAFAGSRFAARFTVQWNARAECRLESRKEADHSRSKRQREMIVTFSSLGSPGPNLTVLDSWAAQMVFASPCVLPRELQKYRHWSEWLGDIR